MQVGLVARVSALVLAAGFVFSACSQEAYGVTSVRHHGRRHAQHQKNLLQAAQAAGFHKFVGAVKTAGLAGTLEKGGPYTVFAPTDEAFAKLGAKEWADISKDPKALRAVLCYHIVKGKHDAASLQNAQTLKTIEGQNLVVTYKDKVEVGGGIVTSPDVKASNGLLHGIDEVLKPNTVR